MARTRKALPKIETESIADKARRAVRDHVLAGELKPGTQLVEGQLAEQLGVSRAPVREALLKLESEGLVESVPNKGTFVADISEEDLWEIYTVRAALEGVAMRLAAREMDGDQLGALAQIVERMEQAARDGDAERVSKIDLEFHEAVWALSGNRRLYRLLASMTAQIRMFLALNVKVYEDLLDNCLEHVALLGVLRSGDSERAEQLMVKHISEAGESSIHYLRDQKRLSGSRGRQTQTTVDEA